MFTTKNIIPLKTEKRLFLSFILFSLLAQFTITSAAAQNKSYYIDPLKTTQLTKIQYDIYAFASRGHVGDAMMLGAFSNQYNKGTISQSTHAKIGLNGYINIRNDFGHSLGANIGVSYTHERIARGNGLFGNDGVYTSWLNTDFNLSLLFLSCGMCFDFFLGSRVVNTDSFSYEGINDRCFNSFACCTYASIYTTFRKFKIEMRAGIYLKPHINANKIAYYNLVTSYVYKSHFEIKVYYRIFTNGNRINSPQRMLIIKGQSI